jgi:AcrR family transcriptional regulator
MTRQARSEVTRRKVITSAVELFNEIGYAGTGLGHIIEHAEVTKGALYYHFDSKEALAAAIIREGSTNLFNVFRGITESSAPALENLIHALFVVADLASTDQVARCGTQLMRTFGEFSTVASNTYAAWIDETAALTSQAIDEGDVRSEVDSRAVGETILATVLGVELLSYATTSGHDILDRLVRAWEVLMPAIVSDESLPYFREFLARESMRTSPPPTG